MSGDAFLAVDWGTTNRRVYLIDGGTVKATERDDRGVLAVSTGHFAAEVAAMRARLGNLPVICAGMVGSERGWAAAPYRPCPAGLRDLADDVTWVEVGRSAIVPGVSFAAGACADVMRGEEVQLLGAVTAAMAPADALLCQPGTHCKWVQMAGGRIASFRTTITWELFRHLQKHSLLAGFMTGRIVDGEAFRAGIAAAGKRTLLGDLFGARAAVLTGKCSKGDTAAFVSGLVIGSDVLEQAMPAGRTVHLLADAHLGELYAAAIEAAGCHAVLLDSNEAFLAGITRLWGMIQ
jgi:2-dehydro-3-deoxygalactonokinase